MDVTLNLSDVKYHSFHKPNGETTKIHVQSDHPPQFIKKISWSIEQRLVQLSSTKQIIGNFKEYYEQRLKQCRFNEKLNYAEENKKTNPKSRQHAILCFNPPYNKSIETNMNIFFPSVNK